MTTDAIPLVNFTSDPGAELAVLAVEEGTEARTSSRAAGDAAHDLEEQDDAAAVQAMHDKASSIRASAWFDAGVALGSALCSSNQSDTALVSAGQKLGDSLFSADEANDDASVKASETAADDAKYSVDQDAAAAGDASDYTKAALDSYRQYVETEAQTQAAAIRA